MSTTETITGTRIIELDEREIAQLVVALEDQDARPDGEYAELMRKVCGLVEYRNEIDEFARLTMRDRRLKAERSDIAKRLAALTDAIVEQMADLGVTQVKHDALGKTVRIDSKLWAKYEYDGERPTDEERQAAAQALIDAGLDQYVAPAFNTNSVSAFFRERLKAWQAEQSEKPEHERQPLTDDVLRSWLPEPMRDLWHLDNTPTLVVR